MNSRLALLTCPWIVFNIACSETTPGNTLDSNTVTAPKISVSLDTISDIQDSVGESRAITTSNGDIVLFWEHYETQEPSGANTLCQRTSLMTRRYSSANNSWGDATSFQSGVWRIIARNDTKDGTWKSVNNGINTELQLGVGSNNTLFALWVQDTVSDCETDNELITAVYESRYTSGAWSTPTTLVTTPSDNATNPVLAVSSQNYAIAAWQTWKKVTITVNSSEVDTGNRVSIIKTTHFDGVDTWDTPFIASDTDANSTSGYFIADKPAVTIDSSNNGALAWRQINDGVSELRALNYLAATGWNSSSVKINSSTDMVSEIDIASDGNNNTWLAWTALDSDGVGSVYVNSLASDDTVGSVSGIQGDIAATAEDEREQPASSPRIAIGDNAEITVAWKQVQSYNPLDIKWNNSSANTLWANHLSKGAWGGAKLIVGDEQLVVDEQRISIVDFTLGNIGNAFALTWLQDNDSRNKYPQSIYNAAFQNGSWGSASFVEDLQGNTIRLDAQDSSGQVTNSWISTSKTIDEETAAITASFTIGISSVQ